MADKDGSKTHPKKQEIVRLERTDRPAPEISLHGLPEFLPGWVWLTGAGPGDPGLLTLHAVNALQQADCVVYDALVSEDILSLTRTEAELIYSGKRGGKPSLRQEDISRQLVSLAQEKKRVLRLEGRRSVCFRTRRRRSPGWCRRKSRFALFPAFRLVLAGWAMRAFRLPTERSTMP